MLLANSGNGYGDRSIVYGSGHSADTGRKRPRRIGHGKPSAPCCTGRLACRAGTTQTMPISNALSTARVRSRTPSLERMLETWFFTVPSATVSELAISLLL